MEAFHASRVEGSQGTSEGRFVRQNMGEGRWQEQSPLRLLDIIAWDLLDR